MSQRILNVMMPDMDVPIHKHSYTSEMIIICRGKVRCKGYAKDGTKISEHVLEAGSVIFEAKDRPYDPVEK